MTEPQIAIEVSGVHKSFRMPTHKVETLKERALHPFKATEFTDLRALDDVSLEVAAGEFFGIAGRNGSGKTTLLKLLASVYGADRGTIRIGGRVAPFIELGVGFNPNLAAKDNVLLNGVMMGLTPKEARDRYERVIDFAELKDFSELKLKNYSSGMRVRLGFAMLMAADADILLIDEVLAVGDAAFQQKCADAFHDLREQGKTIVLVTHAMDKLHEYCDRALLLHEGRVDCVGDPGDVGSRYLDLNFKRSGPVSGADDQRIQPPGVPQGPARIAGFWFENESGQPADTFRYGEPVGFGAVVEATVRVDSVCFGLVIRNHDGLWITHIRSENLPASGGPLEPGERLHLRGTIENVFTAGRYYADVGLTPRREENASLYAEQGAAELLVYGTDSPGGFSGVITPRHELRAERERARELASR
jgi:ABC-type polysaccharide/polyol phosphate transport system ATPase subunit